MDSTLRTYLKNRHGEGRAETAWPRHRESSEPLRFVVHQHAARYQHYDLRIEVGGRLCCWAIPHGPSSAPREARMARMVEDLPPDQVEFEGVIPRGENGAGEVILWDTGVYSPDDDAGFFFGDRDGAEERVERGIASGRLSLFFWGYKLAGSWSLVRKEGRAGEWLFQKQDDLFAEPDRDLLGEGRSVVSGRTIEELREESSMGRTRRKRA